MKKLLVFTLALATSMVSLAQSYVSTTTLTNTPVLVVTTPVKLLSTTLMASTANVTTFKFYDNNDATAARTNVVYGATVSYSSYSTNYSVVITNRDSVVLTNTFSGLYTAATTVAAVTNERPRIVTITVPASGTRTIELNKYLGFGLVVQSDYAGVVEVEYQTGK